MRLTGKERQNIGRDYRRMPVANVLRKYGISRRLLYEVIGSKRGQKPRKVDDNVASTIATLNYRGYSDSDIARKLGLAQDTVWRHRNKMGLPVVPRESRIRKHGKARYR